MQKTRDTLKKDNRKLKNEIKKIKKMIKVTKLSLNLLNSGKNFKRLIHSPKNMESNIK